MNSIPIGKCTKMCPPKEEIWRKQNGLVSRFERNHLIKSFGRSAAGQNLSDPENLRPGSVLTETTQYLVDLMLINWTVNPIELYEFINDRFRSIRQDAVIQRLEPQTNEPILKTMVRFYLLTKYLLADNAKFEKVLNDQQLKECLDTVIDLYKNGYDRCEEMVSVYVLVNLEHERLKLFTSGIVSDLWLSWLVKNYWRTLDLAEKLPLLLRVAFNGNLPAIRLYALRALACAYSSTLCRYPLMNLMRILKYNSIHHLQNDLETLGIKFTDDCAQFRKADVLPFINIKLSPTKWSAIDDELTSLAVFFKTI